MHDKINLLPDSKQQRLNEKKFRKLTTTIAVVVSAIAVGVPILLLTIKGAQAIALNRAQDEINRRKSEIQQTPDITTMLTVKDHLNTLPSLYAQRTYMSRLLNVVTVVMPRSITLTDLTIDSTGTISIKGATRTYAEVERLYKKIMTFKDSYNPNRVETDPNQIGLFTNVVTEEVTGPSGTEVVFKITTNYDAAYIIGALTSGGNNEVQ